HVVFASAFPHSKLPRRTYPPVARIEAQHHFTETHLIPATSLFGTNLHAGSFCSEKVCGSSLATDAGARLARGSTKSQATAPSAATGAATRKPVPHPKLSPSQGVTLAVSAPPI